MDNELDHLEAELKGLQPAELSPELVARIERDLTQSPVHVPSEVPTRRALASMHWLWMAALPAAAAVALVAGRFSSKPPAQETTVAAVEPAVTPAPALPAPASTTAVRTALKPVAAENLLVYAADEGLVTLDDGTPARRERLQYVDTITWKNPRTNASLTWRVPREEVRVVPVSFQ